MGSRLKQAAAACLPLLVLALSVPAPSPSAASEKTTLAIAQNQTMIRLGLASVTAGRASGSAFFVGKEGYLVTSQQVVGQAAIVIVRLPTGGMRRGEVVKRDAALGVALIRVLGAVGEALPIQLQAPKVGTRLFAVGAPLEETPVTAGRVRGYLSGYGREVMQSDLRILPAGAGGPVLDEFGNIVALAKRGQSGRSDLIPIKAAVQALGLGGGKLALPVTPAALRSPLPDASAPQTPAGAGSERAAWDAIRRSRKQADYAAFLGAYPKGEFAGLARKRAAVPENRLWDAVFAEPVPPGQEKRVLDYLKDSPTAAVRSLSRYIEKNNVPVRHQSGIAERVSEIQDIEVLHADQDGAIAKLIYLVGSRNWGGLNTHIFELRWIGGELEPVRHQKL